MRSDPATVYLASLAEGSRDTMRHSLKTIARIATDGAIEEPEAFPFDGLRPHHVAAIRSRLAEDFAPATANKTLSALRGVLKAAWRMGLIDSETFHRTSDIAPVRGSRVPAGRHVTQGELASIFRTLADDLSPAARRDAALIACLYGCRRAEVAGLDVADLDLDERRVRARGKGNKERHFYLGANGGVAAVRAWLDVRGDADGPLFVPINKGGNMSDRRMSVVAVFKALNRRREAAGVAPFTPHDLRRSFIGDMLDTGTDIATVQGLVGHASPTTTARYDRRPERTKADAVNRVHVPYVEPATCRSVRR